MNCKIVELQMNIYVFLSAQKICRQLRVPDILGAHGKCKLEKDGEIHKVILLLNCTIVKLRMIISAFVFF